MISNFSKEYFFLSNFYNVYLTYEGTIYCSTEAAFQAAKTLDFTERERIARMSPSDAKKAGRRLQLRSDWENIKDKVMYDVCRAKFTMNDSLGLRERLLSTGDEELVEGNTWHDNYWGNCTCDKCKDIPGRNQLGKTLMKIRSELRGEDCIRYRVVDKQTKRDITDEADWVVRPNGDLAELDYGDLIGRPDASYIPERE